MILPHAILVPELPLGCDAKSSGISWCYCNIRIHIYFTSNQNYIDEESIGFCAVLNIVKILNIIQNNQMNFQKFIKLLYYDSANNEFYKYILECIKKIKEENKANIIKIMENIDIVCQKLKDFLII